MQRSSHLLDIEIITEPRKLAALESDWRDLCALVPDHEYAQTFEWAWRGWECVASKRARELRVVVGRADERVVLIDLSHAAHKVHFRLS